MPSLRKLERFDFLSVNRN